MSGGPIARWLGRAGLALAISASALGCASVADVPADPTPLPQVLQTLAARHGVCGVAVAVIRQRRLAAVETAQGCASTPPPAPDTVFQAASLSKPVFAYAVLKLVQEGKLSLDAPVMGYLPEGYLHRSQALLPNSPTDRVTDPRVASVTVRMLLNHTSGMPNWSGGPLTFRGTPGERWRYSGEGFVLLQRAAEAVSGQGLDELVRTRVFAPAGMVHSAYRWDDALGRRLLPGTTRDGVPMRSWRFGEPVAAFTLYTSAQDYGRFLTLLLADDRALRLIAEAPVPVNPRLGLGWGLGWGTEQAGDGGADTFLWHWGNNPGYRAFVLVSPKRGDGLVMLTNGEDGLRLAEPLARQVLPGAHPVFRFHMLRDGLDSLLCETLDLCA